MKKIVLIAYIAITTLFCAQDATALTAENSSTCIFDDMGYSYTGDISNSVSSNCASRHYYRLRNRQTGETYGVWQECTKCDSSHYLVDTQSYMAHHPCGNISFYGTCTAKTTCSTTVSSAPASSLDGCTSAAQLKFGSSTIYSCNVCNSGYTRTSESVSDKQCTNTITRYYCKAPTCTAVTVSTYSTPTMTGCKTQVKKSFGGKTYDTCDTCKSGYFKDMVDTTTISSSSCSNTVSAYSCVATCVPSSAWECTGSIGAGNPGFCMFRGRGTNNGQCLGANYITCPAGYYGTAPDSCTKCPDMGEGEALRPLKMPPSTAMKTTAITDCYMTKGADASGTYEYVVNATGSGETPYMCHYSE